ncbi:MAG: hypothetical protein LC791_08405 [Acidobacteria bacterium]|nr:hypothetical protein [Acidobacteriota bacterium]
MQQALHLLTIDLEQGLALGHWQGSRWLLPVLYVGERVRPGPLVQRWLAARGWSGLLVGQWLGRATHSGEVLDWLGIVIAPAGAGQITDASLTWAPIRQFASSRSIVDYQQWALATTLDKHHVPSVPGPFGSPIWYERVKAWIDRQVGTTSSPIPYRTSCEEVVLGLTAPTGTVYFKGLPCDRAAEAHVTVAMSSLAPGWLPPVDVSSATVWAVALLQEQGPEMARRIGRVEQASDAVSVAHVSQTWIPLDLDPTNVLLDEEEVRFIDLDDSYLGPAPLAITTFARRVTRAHVAEKGAQVRGAIYRAYDREWSPARRAGDRWPAFEIVSVCLEEYLGWKRLEGKTARGEVSGVLEIARARVGRRLANAVSRVTSGGHGKR